MAKEIKAAAEPLRRFLEKYYDPTVEVVVDTGVVTVKRGEYMTIFQKEEVPEENEWFYNQTCDGSERRSD